MGNYDDIIDLPRHVSPTRPPMSMHGRAAQFSPFAALTGFGDEIAEAARLTDRRVELTEAEEEAISRSLAALTLPAEVSLTYFVPDPRKAGGRYATERVTIRQILPEEGRLKLTDGRGIELDRLIEVKTHLRQSASEPTASNGG